MATMIHLKLCIFYHNFKKQRQGLSSGPAVLSVRSHRHTDTSPSLFPRRLIPAFFLPSSKCPSFCSSTCFPSPRSPAGSLPQLTSTSDFLKRLLLVNQQTKNHTKTHNNNLHNRKQVSGCLGIGSHRLTANFLETETLCVLITQVVTAHNCTQPPELNLYTWSEWMLLDGKYTWMRLGRGALTLVIYISHYTKVWMYS